MHCSQENNKGLKRGEASPKDRQAFGAILDAQSLPKSLPNPSQIHPKSSPNRPRIHPEGLLEVILDQCNEKVRFPMRKNHPGITQRRTRDTLEGSKDLANCASDPSRSIIFAIFEQFFEFF